MIPYVTDLWNNKPLICAVAAWAIAQAIKTILYTMINREFRFERMVGSGGMPSSHAATVCALTVSAIKQFGLGSFEFAVSFILSIVVLIDARGVRLETGKQAITISAIIDHFIKEGTVIDLPKFELKELIGHTPVQVGVGMLIGITVGIWLG